MTHYWTDRLQWSHLTLGCFSSPEALSLAPLAASSSSFMAGMGKGTVCVTGGAGFIGSWLVMRLLEQGYSVNATVRDPNNTKKLQHLLDLPEAGAKLKLWKADLSAEGSFDEPIKNCVGVFHVATPMDFDSTDPENEVVKPAVDGMLNVLKSCAKAGTVKRVVFTSTAGTVCVQPVRKNVYDEESWTDTDFCRAVKMNGWMYFISKTLAEKAAWEFVKEHNMDLISIIPTLVAGPFIMNTMPTSMDLALALFNKSERHYPTLNPVQFVHMDDLCRAHIFLFENPEAKGRYICSSHNVTLPGLAEMLKSRYPEYDIPTKFEGIQVVPEVIDFSSKKLIDLGFEYKHTIEDMFDDAIRCCKEKGLMP